MKILVVDDSMLARIGLIKVLKVIEPGAEIYEASDGLEGVNVFKKESPDVTYMDLTMPVMSGYEAIENIMLLDPKAQIIVVSADIQKQAEETVLKLGAKMLVQKPIKETKMQDILKSLHI